MAEKKVNTVVFNDKWQDQFVVCGDSRVYQRLGEHPDLSRMWLFTLADLPVGFITEEIISKGYLNENFSYLEENEGVLFLDWAFLPDIVNKRRQYS